jgi:hypothetical protein
MLSVIKTLSFRACGPRNLMKVVSVTALFSAPRSRLSSLEFFQHHFFQMGHRDLLVTQNLSQPASTTAPLLTRSVCRSGGYVLTAYSDKCPSRAEARTEPDPLVIELIRPDS